MSAFANLILETCECGHDPAGHMDLRGRCLLYVTDPTMRKVNPWRLPIRRCDCEEYTAVRRG